MRTSILGVVAALCLLASICGLLAYFSGLDNRYLVAFTSFTPFVVLFAVLGALAAAIGRRWLLLTASVVVLSAGAWLFAPMYIADPVADAIADAPESTKVRVMQSNLMLGLADPTEVVRTVGDRGIDILTVQELTNDAVSGLDEAGLANLLPYRFVRPTSEGGGGSGIYSRYPLSAERELPTFLLWNLVADVEVGADKPVRVYSVHPVPPYPSPTPVWAAEMALLKDEVSTALDRPHVIVSGDFNSTVSHKRFRDIVDVGYTDAAASTGSGLIPTYPTDKSYPAVVGIDHILTRGAVATSLERIAVEGSDHHGLVAEIVTTG